MYARKTDLTHASIREGLRQLGYSVADCSRMGKGFPDLLVGVNYFLTVLVECKTLLGKTKRSKKTATDLLQPEQRSFRDEWKGTPVIVAASFEEAHFQISLLKKRYGWVK